MNLTTKLFLFLVVQLISFSFVTADEINQTNGNDRSNEYLIVFQSPGLIDQHILNDGMKSSFVLGSLQADHDRFKSDLLQIRQNKSGLKSLSLPSFKNELYRTMNAVVMDGNEEEMEEIKKLDYVKAVVRNQKVFLSNSISSGEVLGPLLQKAEASYSETGKGVKIGVIDTGIDYTNPALGGGYGPGYKVAGGYDFASLDDDPMDLNGHGTAVAGIIAAKGSLMGVAPDATLYAFKVFNKDVFAWSADIDQALELALDPNRDFDMSDHMDVINMSIGIDEAMNKLWLDLYAERMRKFAKMNIVICVASGNKGPTYNKINALCLIEDVIAVGSCNANNQISAFSSRGFGKDINDCNMKPDIVALGENMVVYGLSSNLKIQSGTSLSSPYMAGVAALLKQRYPNLTYNEYKSALLNSATDLGVNLFDQGAGKVNPQAALNLQTLCYPQSVNIGFVPNNQGVEEKELSITLYNKSSVSQEYRFDIGRSVPKGVEVKIEPQSMVVPANDSLRVYFNIKLNLEQLSVPQLGPLNIYGRFHLYGSIDSLQIPWTFSRGYYLEFFTDIKAVYTPTIIIVKDNKVINPSSGFTNGMQYFLQQGSYDILFNASEGLWGKEKKDTTKSYLFAKENVQVSGNTTINFNKSEIKNRIEFDFKSHNNGAIPEVSWKNNYSVVAVKSNNFGIEPLISGKNSNEYYVNNLNLSNRYELLAGRFLRSDDQMLAVVVNHEAIRKIEKDTVLTKTSEKLQPFHFLFYPSPNEASMFGVSNFYYYSIYGHGGYIEKPFDKPTFFTLWIDEKEDKSVGLSAFPHVTPAQFTGALYPFNRFSHVYSYGDSIAFNTLIGNEIVLSQSRSVRQSIKRGDTIFVNNGLVYYCLSVTADKYNFRGCFTELKGMYGESRNWGYVYSTLSVLNSENQLVYIGTVKDAPTQFYSKDMKGATIELTTYDYYVMGVRGKATLKYNFNQQNAPNVMSSINSMQVLNEKGQVRPQFDIGSSAMLNMTLNQATITESISLYFKYSDETEWKEHPFSRQQTLSKEDFIQVDISDLLTRSIGLDFRVVKKDKNGNLTSFTLEPAIAIGDYHQNYNLSISPTDHKVVFKNNQVKEKLKFTAFFPRFDFIDWKASLTEGAGKIEVKSDSVYIVPDSGYTGMLKAQIKGSDGRVNDSTSISILFNQLKDNSFKVSRNTLNGEVLGALELQYPQTDIKYHLSGDAASIFSIDSINGKVSVKDVARILARDSISFEVVASDHASSDTARVVVYNTSSRSVDPLMGRLIPFPNPTARTVQIEMIPEGSVIELYNLNGKKLQVTHQKTSPTSVLIDLNDYESGVYILKVSYQKQSGTYKVIKL